MGCRPTRALETGDPGRRRRKEGMSAMVQDQHTQQDPTTKHPQPEFPQQLLNNTDDSSAGG
jgi:hypothetical protein